MNVLLVEDEPGVANVIKKGLTENGYNITVAPDGNIGFDIVTSYSFDVIILDIMLPGINGVQLCRKMREQQISTPILFLTALGTTENIVTGLDAGADDYLVKPFKFIELEARLRSLSRRKVFQIQENKTEQISDISIDLDSKTVAQNGMPVILTATEFRLLEYFLKNKNRVLSRMDILENVWGIDFNMGTNVVDVYVNYLRKKIDKNVSRKSIHTVVGMGYMLKV